MPLEYKTPSPICATRRITDIVAAMSPSSWGHPAKEPQRSWGEPHKERGEAVYSWMQITKDEQTFENVSLAGSQL